MTQEEILEGNKLIAEFMGVKRHSNGIHSHWTLEDGRSISQNLYYDESWDWLMPVVDKMEEMGYCFTSDPWSHQLIEYGTGEERVILTHEFDSDNSKIEELYFAVLEFIKWYNQQF